MSPWLRPHRSHPAGTKLHRLGMAACITGDRQRCMLLVGSEDKDEGR